MSAYWFLFASLTVVGSLGYNVMTKLGASSMNAFTYVLIMSGSLFAIQTVVFLVAKYGFKVDVMGGLTSQSMIYPLAASLSVALIDIAFFFALRYGTPIQCQTFWTVGGTLALAIFSVLIFKEVMTPTKALGLVFGIASLLLIMKP